MTLHLFIIKRCTHNCALCCNKQYDIEKIPVVTVDDLKSVDAVCLTGGEPFLYDGVCDFAEKIKKQYTNIKNIYVYSCGDSLMSWLHRNETIHGIDGVSLAPKDRHDVECLEMVFGNIHYETQIAQLKSNRLYVFPDVYGIADILMKVRDFRNIQIIDREWQEDFKPADDSIFRRLPILFD